jgi:nucleolar GTP-binding protein
LKVKSPPTHHQHLVWQMRALLRSPQWHHCASVLLFSGPPRRHIHPWLAAERSNAPPSGPSSLGELPDFRGPSRLLKDAYKQSMMVQQNPKIANAKKRTAKFATQRIDAYASGLSVALREQLSAFRQVLRNLPPFEKQLAELTLAALEREGKRSLRDVEYEFDQLRRAVVRSGKAATAEASAAATAKDASELMKRGIDDVQAAFVGQQEALLELIETSQRLRRLPRPVEGDPVLVLVGMPNVGKSSLVSATSTGTPEINDYPFTTRRLKMGHVIGHAGRYQVMDTPGVLARPEVEMNPMEGLTLAAVEHLPSAVVFVMDLSGTCGPQSAPLLQLGVREEIKRRYPDRPWIDVRSKADLPLAPEVPPDAIPPDALHVSVHEATGVDQLRRELAKLVGGQVEGGLD